MRFFALSLLVLVATIGANALDSPRPVEATFYRNVLPILQKNCQSCHRPGEVAPMPLLTYEQTRPWAKAIREVVAEKKMPPWFADPSYGHFENDRRLSPEEIKTVVDWVDGGAKPGDPKDAPRPLTFGNDWSNGKPDLVIEMPVDFPIPASGIVEYTWFVVPTRFTEDKWVQNIEVRPGDRSVVHHMIVLAREPRMRDKYLKNAKPGEPFVPPKGQLPTGPDDGTGEFQLAPGGGVELIATYAPGSAPSVLRPGQARLIKAGSDLIFQMHYTASGKATVDRSRVGLTFAKEPPRERVVTTDISNLRFRIPPGVDNHQVFARVTLYQDTKLLALFPHMHLRGKSFEYRAIYPTGETEVLLRVPKYNFNWQLTYSLKLPKALPKGTRIECVAIYDNSPKNPANPDPSAEVHVGPQTWEEMLTGFMDLAFDPHQEPRITKDATETIRHD
jgi:hypothetical protein